MTYVGHDELPRPDHLGWAEHPSRTPPTSSAQASAAESDRSRIELRNLAVDRMRQMNAMHAMHAYDRCRSREPIGPHGLAFLYRDSVIQGRHTTTTLRAATRLFLDGDDVREIYHLLDELIGIGRDYLNRGEFDPRRTMSNRHDEMSPQAEYVGVSISTLDTRHGTWSQIQRRASTPLEVPGLCYTILGDGTRMIVERDAGTSVGSTRIYSTHPLTDPRNPVRIWTWLRDPNSDGLGSLWLWLGALHNLAVDGYQAALGR